MLGPDEAASSVKIPPLAWAFDGSFREVGLGEDVTDDSKIACALRTSLGHQRKRTECYNGRSLHQERISVK